MGEFAWKTFLQCAGNDSLKEYIKNKGLPNFLVYEEAKTDGDLNPEKNISSLDLDKTLAEIQNLEVNSYRLIEEEFRMISSVLDLKGQHDLNAEALQQGIEIPQNMNETQLGLWFYLNHPHILEAVRIWDKIEGFEGWDEEDIDLPNNVEDLKNKEDVLSKLLKKHFWELERRKINCDIEVFCHDDRYCYVAYPEGFPKSFPRYDKGKITHRVERPIKMIFFVIHLTESRISIKSTVRYGIPHLDKLKKLFIEDALGLKYKNNLADKEFDLNQFLEESFGAQLKEKAGAERDGVDFIKIRAIAWKQSNDRGKEGVLTAKVSDDQEKNRDAKEIYELLKDHNVNRNMVLVKAVTIQVKFPGDGNAGSKTFKIRWPNTLVLGKDQRCLKCREYLMKWSILKQKTDGENKE